MKKLFYILIPFLFAFASCIKVDQPADKVAVENSDEIAFMVKGLDQTKASVVNTDNLSTLYVTATTGTSTETAAFSKVSFAKSGSLWKGNPAQYWPISDPGYHFYATNSNTLATNSGVTTITLANVNTDVVAAYIGSTTFKTNHTLTMDHVLARVGSVTMKAEEGCTVSGLTLTLKPITTGTYNLKSAAWTPGSAASADTFIMGTSASSGVAITTAGGTANKANDVWIVPGIYQLTCKYTISKGAASKTYTRTANINFAQGKVTNLGLPGTNGDEPNLKFDDSDISEIAFTVTVKPWEEITVPVEF